MDNEYIERPFQAYEGDEKYIFVSYAHLDKKRVFPEIERFHKEGYPIWYDDGLTAGQEWDEEIAKHLVESSLVVVFISKNSMASTNVHDEIKLALNRKIDITPIYLEDTQLPLALELRLSNKHAIFKHKESVHDKEYLGDCFKAFKKAGIPKLEFDELIGLEDDGSLNLDIPDFNGDEPYIFACYAHSDTQALGEIERFRNDGYNVLSDENFPMGAQWFDAIEKGIEKCSLFVFFASKNSFTSASTTQELHLALQKKIDVVPIYLEEAEITDPEIRFMLSIVPGIFKYAIPEEEYVAIYKKIFEKYDF